MRGSHLVQFLKRRSLLLSILTVIPMVAVILSLTACVKHPVGDPEKSRVDSRFVGVWSGNEGGDELFMIFRDYDARTYLVTILGFKKNEDGVRPRSREDHKAWLTKIGGETFITMEPLHFAQFTGEDEESYFIVAKIDIVDGAVHLRIVNSESDLVQNVKDRHELEKVITAHVNSEVLYADPAMVYTRNEDKNLCAAVIDAFHTWSDDEP